jgi:hypothetical protein
MVKGRRNKKIMFTIDILAVAIQATIYCML